MNPKVNLTTSSELNLRQDIFIVWPEGKGRLKELNIYIENGDVVIRTPYAGHQIDCLQIDSDTVIISYPNRKNQDSE